MRGAAEFGLHPSASSLKETLRGSSLTGTTNQCLSEEKKEGNSSTKDKLRRVAQLFFGPFTGAQRYASQNINFISMCLSSYLAAE